MSAQLPRMTSPCSENLDAMKKTERGVFCDKCQHDVVDLRKTPRKKALAVLSELRAASSNGRVCVRAMFRSDGTPVFRPDAPSAFARFTAPLALVSSLAACAPSSHSESVSTPITLGSNESSGGNSVGNVNGHTQVAVVAPVTVPTPQPTIFDMPEEAAGGLMWEGP